MDIATFTVGGGLGAKARIGPICTGLSFYMDGPGIRNGVYVDGSDSNIDIAVFSGAEFEDGMENYHEKHPNYDYAYERGKTFKSDKITFFLTAPKPETCYYFYSQIELIASLGLGLRIGVNPGEMLDFILGWVKIDIYNDDVKRSEIINSDNSIQNESEEIGQN